jgi:hypothetical protein
MISVSLMFDVSPVAGGIGAAVGIGFFLVLAAVAFIAFKMLKRTVKMAVRMVIVGIILVVALVGGIALLMFSGGGSGPGKTPPAQQKSR